MSPSRLSPVCPESVPDGGPPRSVRPSPPLQGDGHGTDGPGHAPGTSGPSRPTKPVARYRCHTCAATFTAWAPCERHSDAEHHHRIDVALVEAKEPGAGAGSLPPAPAPEPEPTTTTDPKQ